MLKRIATLFLVLAISLSAEPILSSWFTDYSGQYARIYETDADQLIDNAVTTWNRGLGIQEMPVYAGVHEIAYDNDWVYLRTSNLAGYVMGPWYGNPQRTNLFPNYPANTGFVYQIPRNPTNPTTVSPKQVTGGGSIGFMVNGVSMYDSRDAFSYNNATGTEGTGNGGDRTWNRDAFVNESVTFDAGNAHQGGITHHYHANPSGLRHQMGDSVDYDLTSNSYTENFNGSHSPIIAWVDDGLPLYGPYGYSEPLDPTSGVRRMISGFQIRSDIAATGSPRNSWPAWATRTYGALGVSFAAGPNVSAQFPLGRYLEDNDFKGDLAGFSQYTSSDTQGVFNEAIHYDLNEYNVRWCITPEFPSGTWAYFTCIEADGTPDFPYNISRTYFGDPEGDNVDEIPVAAIVYFEGGPEAPLAITEVETDPISEDVTLVWSAVEGGNYRVQKSDLVDDWEDLGSEIVADAIEVSVTDTDRLDVDSSLFYRVRYTGLAEFDDEGFVYTPPTGIDYTKITVTLSSGGTPPPADLDVAPLALQFNGVDAALVSRPSQYLIEVLVDLNGLSTGDYSISADFGGGAGTWTGDYAYSAPEHNILLIIVDDWAIDSSPVDNPTGASLPTMANLQFLADNGLRFTNAYAQPTCSPTRAGITTGRHSFRHGIGAPGGANLPESEIALAEVISNNANYELAMYGKWHLGGGIDGPSEVGGWDEFKGIFTSGVTDYYDWQKLENGAYLPDNVTTYATTEIAQDTIDFIAAQPSNQKWFAWVAFNAPHSPFHEPLDTDLLQSTWDVGDTDTRSLYEKSLEAMDTEIGRILENVDLTTTNVILIGDNGTPNGVAQAPFSSETSKGQLYDGGTHVPLIIAGPSVKSPGVTDEPVHCVDLYSTIIAMAGMNRDDHVPGTTVVDGRSLLPTLAGQDVDDAVIVVENFGNAEPNNGRAILKDGYKLVIYDDPNDANDIPSYEFYYLPDDENEQNDLLLTPVTEEAITAYNSIVDYNVALGGNFDAGSYLVSNVEVLYIELPNPGNPEVPGFTNGNGAIEPTEILIGGHAANFIARVNASEIDDQYWVKASFDPVEAGLSAGSHNITVQFRDHPVRGTRIYDSPTVYVVD